MGIIIDITGDGGKTTDASELTTGTLGDQRLSSQVTKQGNTFNGANQLVQVASDGKLPSTVLPDPTSGTTLTANQEAAINNANAPSAGNPFATTTDIVAAGGNELDPFTGEIITRQTLDWADTLENDAKVDGVTITKEGTVYKKRVVPNGKYNLKWWGAIGDGISHPVSEWLIGGVRDRGYADLAAIQVDYPRATSSSYSIDWVAWEACKAAIPAEGGTIYIPNGKYISNQDGWYLLRHNTTVEGESKEGTLISNPTGASAVGFGISGYRRQGWKQSEDDLVVYEDIMDAGQGWIKPKDPTDLAKFSPGEAFFIVAGASYYDQEFGEFNIVRKVDHEKIFLKWNLGRGYNTSESTYSGEVLTDFTPPLYGEDVVANIKNSTSVGFAFSIGNDLYKVIAKTPNAVNGDDVTLRSIRTTNSTGLVVAGTKCFEHRALVKTPESFMNTIVKNISIEGNHNSIRLSNSVNSYFENCYFKWLGNASGGGIWLDGDDGRNAHFVNCTFDSFRPYGSQPARSFTDMSFKHCTFTQTGIHFSEFNQDCEVMNCKFHIHRVNKTEKAILLINSGATSSGNLSLSLGGTTFNIPVAVGDSIAQVADKVKSFSFTEWTVSSSPDPGEVIFYATTVGDKVNATFSGGSTGVDGVVTSYPEDANFAAVSLGWTTSNIRVHDNEMWLDDVKKGGGGRYISRCSRL